MNLRKKTKSSQYTGVGLDIGNSSIKVVGLKKEFLSKKTTLSFGIEYIPKDATFGQKSELILKALEKAGVVMKRVNISVCGPNVISRNIRMPLMQKYELQDAIELEWDKYVSLKKDEVNWDYAVLDTPTDEVGTKYMQVLLVAVKKNFIDERLNLLKATGLEAQLIDIDSTALVNTFKFSHPSRDRRPAVILNLGEYFTNEVILKNGVCWFARDIHIGGYDLTGIIAERLHLALPEAEKLKCSLDSSKAVEIYNLIKPILDNLINEVKLSLEYIKRELKDEVSIIYISGGGARLYQLSEFLNQNLGIPIKIWGISEDFKSSLTGSQEEFERHFPDLAVAIGLALARKDKL